MAVSRPTYCTREDVTASLDVKTTARMNAEVDRAIESASDTIDGGTSRIAGCLHRRFYPELRTMTFDWPDESRSRSWRLWLNQHELISVTSISSGGVALTAGQYFLRPDDGPPRTHVEIDLADDGAFEGGDTHQRAISITGWYGHSDVTASAGALAEQLDASETAVDVTNSAAVGVGDLLQVDTERMLVTEKALLDTGQNLSGQVGASTADTTIAVASGAAFSVGEVILLDAERMLIVDIAGNTLIVKRAWDGSVLAAHNGSDIYAPRTLTVVRGSVGSTAATHESAAAVRRQVYPPLVRELARAEAINTVLQGLSGYARTIGSGESERAAPGAGLKAIREQAYAAFGRKARKRAV